jgi:hypothetical protein
MKDCFIRKNTPELRLKLRILGCDMCPCAFFKDSAWLNISFIDTPTVHGIGQSELDLFLYENEKSKNPLIDCGEDEEMFLKIAKENLL